MTATFGDRMKQIRNRKGITLDEIAKAIGRTEATVQRYESGNIKNLDNVIIEKIAKILRVQPQYLMGWTDIEASPAIPIPVLGEISAGESIFADENIGEYIPFPSAITPGGELFFLEVKGDSMESNVPEGSLVLIRVQDEVENNEVAAVLVNDDTEATLKRIRYEDGDLYLVPDNKYYMPKKVDENYPVKIIGRAVKIISDVR